MALNVLTETKCHGTQTQLQTLNKRIFKAYTTHFCSLLYTHTHKKIINFYTSPNGLCVCMYKMNFSRTQIRALVHENYTPYLCAIVNAYHYLNIRYTTFRSRVSSIYYKCHVYHTLQELGVTDGQGVRAGVLAS